MKNVRNLSLLLFLVFGAQAALADKTRFSITFLGTGNPLPDPNRFGPSILLQAGDQKLLFDVGRGALLRLAELKVTGPDINAVFLTHLHSDHITDIDDLLLTGWGRSPFGGRAVPFLIYGPAGTERLMVALRRAYDADIDIRTKVEKPDPAGIEVDVNLLSDGLVYDVDGLKVKAFTVDHGPIKPAFGFLVTYAGRKVLLSGDTAFSQRLVEHAKGVDVLVHEVAAATDELLTQWPPGKQIFRAHTSPEDVAKILRMSRPGRTFLNHVILMRTPLFPPPTLQEVLDVIAAGYDGKVEIAEDLMTVDIGADAQP